ncbi:MAG: hypothetical protein A3H97_16245 [Acidobacteria bacterium RIFCSPLOWO2_02_FULL_65_29]|nr:MAG: hypothetical protein A3H97_16245 [Acidobacteria bacterium RIFCSPLOWO2_02_FULL_65_29]
MPLTAGTRLGPYEIIGALGAGGMGEVYRARDTKLDRDVAIKILPEAFAADAERVARFQREAKTLASLNHPNIAAIYGLEDADGVRALVLELVEGPTLADRVAQGPIPLEEALPIAGQIAEALEAAHDHAIVHRDLKPANIKVTPEGRVKVLDFGLAKAIGPAEAGAGGSKDPHYITSPTITTPAMTQAGMILGTAAYMSPEQAKGKPVDRRADIWAFGCVLYEMLTGRRAFEASTGLGSRRPSIGSGRSERVEGRASSRGEGEDISETLAAILRADPDWRALPTETPANIRTLLRRCLEKDPKKRAPHISVARLELDETRTDAPVDSTPAPGARARAGIAERFAWTAVGALVAAAIGFFAWTLTRNESAPPVVRFQIQPPPGEIFPGAGGAPRFSVSPDGTYVAYASVLAGKREQLWLRRLDSLEAKPVRGTEAVYARGEVVQQPFWSPDGRHIGFFDGVDQKLKKVDTEGGPVQTICELAGNNCGGSWNRDGVILFATVATDGIRRVPASGGKPEQVTTLDASRKEKTHLWPQFLPDGRHFLYHAVTAGGDQPAVYVGSLDSSERTRLVESDAMAVFAPSNLVLYARGESLVAHTLDLGRFELTGEPTAIVESIIRPGNGRIPVSASESGVLVYAAGAVSNLDRFETIWKERSGRSIEASGSGLAIAGPVGTLRLSANGKQLAFTRVPQFAPDVWVYDIERGVPTRLTTDPAGDSFPILSADGSRVIFRSNRSGSEGLYERPVSGVVPERLLFQSAVPLGGQLVANDWSRDGNFVVFAHPPQARSDLWVLPLSGDRKPFPYLTSSFFEGQAALHPDGRWLAYVSDESGANQVVVQPFPDPSTGKWQVSSAGGSRPRWRQDGGELYYVDGKSRIVAVSVRTDGRFEVGAQTPLFEAQELGNRSFDVTPDGTRFVLSVERVSSTPVSLTVAVNWKGDLGKH